MLGHLLLNSIFGTLDGPINQQLQRKQAKSRNYIRILKLRTLYTRAIGNCLPCLRVETTLILARSLRSTLFLILISLCQKIIRHIGRINLMQKKLNYIFNNWNKIFLQTFISIFSDKEFKYFNKWEDDLRISWRFGQSHGMLLCCVVFFQIPLTCKHQVAKSTSSLSKTNNKLN